jgi:hypothetical protein
MTINEAADRLSFVNINDKTYLGVLCGNTVEYAVRKKENCIIEWFKAFNIGECKTVTMGPNTGFAVTPLTRKETMLVEELKARMGYVKKNAVAFLENDLITKNI